jgi:hypothetical protein
LASSAVVKLWTTVKDNAGRVAKTAVQLALANWNPTGTIPAAWKVIIEALINSSSKVEKQSTASVNEVTPTVVPAPRCNREDKVTIDLPDVNGVTHTFRIPTPSVSLAPTLGSDTLDITNTLVTAWATAMMTYAVTSDGVAFTGEVTGGRYIRHKSEKKGGF